jgi:predicted nuclease with TOPRIM domain
MSRYRDNSGIDNTCPKINEVISAIDSVNWDEDSYWDAKTVTEIMEKIRKANSDLRDWGNQMCRERDELQDEFDDLKKENDKLQDEVNYYQKEVKELENKIDTLEDELNSALAGN